MKQIIVSLFDLFFSHVTDVSGNKIENPEDHDSYSAKAITVTMIAIIIILASIDKNKKREQMYVATTASTQGYKGQALWVLYKTFSKAFSISLNIFTKKNFYPKTLTALPAPQ